MATCVERKNETAQLFSYLRKSIAGQPQICFVTGEAGSGKTTLINSFINKIETVAQDTVIAIGECNSHAVQVEPYTPFRDILEMLSGEYDEKLSQKRISAVHAQTLKNVAQTSLETLLEIAPDLIGSIVPAGKLLGTALKTATEKTKILDALKQKADPISTMAKDMTQDILVRQYCDFIQRFSAKYLLVLFIEDLHWIDKSSVYLFSQLVQRIKQGKLLIVGTYRPDSVKLNQDGSQQHLELLLSEIKRKQGNVWIDFDNMAQSVRKEFSAKVIDIFPNQFSETFRSKLFLLTDGNPLFTVEMIKNMQEKGYISRNSQGALVDSQQIDWTGLPTKVEGVIEERISRLEQQLKDELAIASVEGENFTAQVIGRLQNLNERQVLKDLSAELGKRHQLITESGEMNVGHTVLSVYKFNHALFQQYIYNDLGTSQRRLLHKEIAEALELLYHERTDEIAVQLAKHFEESRNFEKAMDYWLLSGKQALKISAFSEARACLERALALDTKNAEKKAETALQLGIVYYGLGDLPLAIQSLEKSIALMKDETCSLVAMSRCWLGRVMVDRGEFHSAKGVLLCAVEIAKKINDNFVAAQALNQLGYVSWHIGDLKEAQRLYKMSISISQRNQDDKTMAFSLYDLGCCEHLLGNFVEAKNSLEKSLELSRAIGDKSIQTYSYNELGWTYYDEGDFGRAEENFSISANLAQEIENKWTRSESLNGLGFIACDLNKLANARQLLSQALHISVSADAITEVLLVIVGHAKLFERQGNLAYACELLGLCLSHSACDSEIKHFAQKTLNLFKQNHPGIPLEPFLQNGSNLEYQAVVAALLAGEANA